MATAREPLSHALRPGVAESGVRTNVRGARIAAGRDPLLCQTGWQGDTSARRECRVGPKVGFGCDLRVVVIERTAKATVPPVRARVVSLLIAYRWGSA